jgi:hypothetical protein
MPFPAAFPALHFYGINSSKPKAMKTAIITGVMLLTSFTNSFCQTAELESTVSPARRMNFYIANKPKTLDLFSRLVIFRAKLQGKKFDSELVVIVASSASEAADRIIASLNEHEAMIGNLWFDSHGRYYNGYSSFILGNDEFSYKTIRDSAGTHHIKRLAPYVDTRTRVAIGSCYSGATYYKPSSGTNSSTRMNGDSLLIGMASLLHGATVYGAEGWVMTKPGLFRKHSYALSGYPIQKKFIDQAYLPVWENLGKWNSYNAVSGNFEQVNSIALTRNGSIHVKSVSYLQKEKYTKRQARKIARIEHSLAYSK